MNMPRVITVLAVAIAMSSSQAKASPLEGPARFCGYAPVIDLTPGEKITTLEGGIHSGRFRWEGPFGSLDVRGVSWASRPRGRIVEPRTDTMPARFAAHRTDQGYVVALWNGAQGAAYFVSESRFTPSQMNAIRRVALFQEGQSPSGCDLRTAFSWE